MEAGMKKYIFIVLLVPLVLFAGLQTALAQSARGNAASVEALPEDLQGVDLKDYYIDSTAQPAGFLRTVIGHVVVLHEDTGQAYFGAVGDAIFKNDAIFTLKDSRCRIRFTTEDIITMGDNGRLGIAEYIDDRVRKKKKTIFSMLRGKAMFYAMRLFKYRTTSSSVKTPTAIIGVRGTKFGVEVEIVGDKIAQSRPIYLADASGAGLQNLLAQAGHAGPPVIVRAYCFNGALNVSMPGLVPGAALPGAPAPPPTVVHAGQDVKVTPKQISPPSSTSSADSNAFIGATNAPDPQAPQGQGQGGTGEQPPAPAPAPAPGASGAPDPTDTSISDKADDVASKQKDKTIEDEGTSQTIEGYFTGMLTHQGQSPPLDNVYVSSSPQNFSSSEIRAAGIIPDGGYIDANPDSGFGGKNPILNQVAYTDSIKSADNLNLAVTASDPDNNEIGSNDYMKWGYWYVVDTFTINGYDHDLWHKGYFIAGYRTPDASVSGISGNYSGDAWGTYHDVSTSIPKGHDMTGSFSCTVNGLAKTVSNFVVYVEGGGYTAFISGASGTFNSSSFDIDPNSTTYWELGPTGSTIQADYRSAHGSLYGPKGEHIGGGWGMQTSCGMGAQGIFKGDKD